MKQHAFIYFLFFSGAILLSGCDDNRHAKEIFAGDTTKTSVQLDSAEVFSSGKNVSPETVACIPQDSLIAKVTDYFAYRPLFPGNSFKPVSEIVPNKYTPGQTDTVKTYYRGKEHISYYLTAQGKSLVKDVLISEQDLLEPLDTTLKNFNLQNKTNGDSLLFCDTEQTTTLLLIYKYQHLIQLHYSGYVD